MTAATPVTDRKTQMAAAISAVGQEKIDGQLLFLLPDRRK
jgi:hypothetical protein